MERRMSAHFPFFYFDLTIRTEPTVLTAFWNRVLLKSTLAVTSTTLAYFTFVT